MTLEEELLNAGFKSYGPIDYKSVNYALDELELKESPAKVCNPFIIQASVARQNPTYSETQWIIYYSNERVPQEFNDKIGRKIAEEFKRKKDLMLTIFNP